MGLRQENTGKCCESCKFLSRPIPVQDWDGTGKDFPYAYRNGTGQEWIASGQDGTGMECILNTKSTANTENVVKNVAISLLNRGEVGPNTSIQKVSGDYQSVLLDKIIELDEHLVTLLPDLKPDVIFVEHYRPIPAIELSGIPCVLMSIVNPLLKRSDTRLPPYLSGLLLTGGPAKWDAFRAVKSAQQSEGWRRIDDYMVSRGCQPMSDSPFTYNDKYLTPYGYPFELDFPPGVAQLPTNVIRLDHFMRAPEGIGYEIPVPLRDMPGKLVYFSLGSMGAIDVVNMKRLVAIMAKSMHRFIVSMGPSHDEYVLPVNMWGQEFVPQIRVLPLVDLVITHGGYNSTIETFCFGKPMIVMPLFADQYDNAQRVQESGLGLRLDPYRCSEHELLSAIDTLLNDKPLNEKLMKISQRIQTDNSLAKLPQIIADYVENYVH
ncbi:unnamed protein product [Medioppia subpectinata]|uniref:UDP-glucuronosyltransferase n=1 Tax=Medioppia subpectinata TaxID=1979941 RepID=A0A7R9L436_9ACAR|nr:unnamed protein product [Medioppia subpectinata]CAG2114891.1 unnamed protein product [Medioppia subpectinata]